MSMITIIRLAFTILNTLVQWGDRRSKINLGVQQEVARQSVNFMRSVGITDEIIATVVNKTPEELDKVLEDRFVD